LRRDNFFRCYLEALAYWLAGIAVMDVIEAIAVSLSWLQNPLGYSLGDRLAQTFNPVFLVMSGIMIVPLFAALLVGSRRSSGTMND